MDRFVSDRHPGISSGYLLSGTMLSAVSRPTAHRRDYRRCVSLSGRTPDHTRNNYPSDTGAKLPSTSGLHQSIGCGIRVGRDPTDKVDSAGDVVDQSSDAALAD